MSISFFPTDLMRITKFTRHYDAGSIVEESANCDCCDPDVRLSINFEGTAFLSDFHPEICDCLDEFADDPKFMKFANGAQKFLSRLDSPRNAWFDYQDQINKEEI
jgi:hypothetical protein